jgi:hypothetical protein
VVQNLGDSKVRNTNQSAWYKGVALRLVASMGLLSACSDSDPDRVEFVPPAHSFHVEGGEQLPYFPSMDAVMEPAPDRLDQFVTEFAPVAKERHLDPTAYWIALHYFISEKFSADAMNGVQGVPLREARWLLYATAYWGGLEMRKNYAQPFPGGFPGINLTEAGVAPMVNGTVALDTALAGSLSEKTALITRLLRSTPPGTGNPIIGSMIFSTSYDNFYIMVISEAPPLGQRQPHLQPLKPNNDIAYPNDFLRIDYADPLPSWLANMRATYELAKTSHPAEFEALLVGAPGDIDLRTLWANGKPTADAAWGGSATARWTQSYFNANAYGTVRWNWGLEATSLAALSALLNNDAATANKALVGNSLFLAAWSAFAYGFQAMSTNPLPAVVLD